MNKIIRKILTAVISASVLCSMAVAVNAAGGSKTERFSGIQLENENGTGSPYEMSGYLTGDLTGGYAETFCNKPVYYIAGNVTGYVIGEAGDRVDLGDNPQWDYNAMQLPQVSKNGGFSPIGVKTGSFWSSHEIRNGVNGVGHYLAVIDV